MSQAKSDRIHCHEAVLILLKRQRIKALALSKKKKGRLTQNLAKAVVMMIIILIITILITIEPEELVSRTCNYICTWMYSHSSSKSQCTFLFARALVSTNIASLLLANSSASSSWTWRIRLEKKPCFLQWKLTRLYVVERKALHYNNDSHHHNQSQWFPHTHWNWSNWITIIFLAIHLGPVVQKLMLIPC